MQLLAVVFVDFINDGLFPLATVVKLITGAVNVPSTFNDDMHVATLFNYVIPETFNVDKHVAALFNVVAPDTFIEELILVLLLFIIILLIPLALHINYHFLQHLNLHFLFLL
jgi:hypothetical protein